MRNVTLCKIKPLLSKTTILERLGFYLFLPGPPSSQDHWNEPNSALSLQAGDPQGHCPPSGQGQTSLPAQVPQDLAGAPEIGVTAPQESSTTVGGLVSARTADTGHREGSGGFRREFVPCLGQRKSRSGRAVMRSSVGLWGSSCGEELSPQGAGGGSRASLSLKSSQASLIWR